MKTISYKLKSFTYATILVVSILLNNNLFAAEIKNSLTNSEQVGSSNPTGGEELKYAQPLLLVENWMASNDFWGTFNATETKENNGYNLIENWMSNDNFWIGETTSLLEYEPALPVDQWMQCNEFWLSETGGEK